MQTLKKDEVLRYLGYKGQEMPCEVDDAIESNMSKITSICNPKFTCLISDIKIVENAVNLKGTNLILEGKDILNHLKDAIKCVTLACTLGVEFDRELLKLQRKSMSDAVIFDACGTAFIEEFADKCEEEILSPFKKDGYYSNFRFSPGYGDLSLHLQKDIINFFDLPKKIGVTVTDSGLLLPQKSITAFIGIFDTPQQKLESKCENCKNKDTCSMRKDGNICD